MKRPIIYRPKILFEPRDLWIGVYWTVKDTGRAYYGKFLHIYVTIIPMFPIHIIVRY